MRSHAYSTKATHVVSYSARDNKWLSNSGKLQCSASQRPPATNILRLTKGTKKAREDLPKRYEVAEIFPKYRVQPTST